MPTKMAGKGLQRATSWVRDITNLEININPAPGNTHKGGGDMLRYFKEEEELLTWRRNKGVHKKIYSYMNHDSGSISNIDDAIIYIPTGAHAAEARGGTFRRALEAV